MPTSPTPPFPLYLLPSLPFRRRSSASTTTTRTSQPSSPTSSPPQPPSFLTCTPTSHLRCTKCLTDLVPITSIISKGFTGRHGRAYLVSPPPSSPCGSKNKTIPNTHTHKPVARQLVTGAHTVADISCVQCGTVLGWKYVAAQEEGQKYKVGNFILETERVVRGVEWEQVEDGNTRTAMDADDDVHFDSQNEDECEDLFSGVWTPGLARRRRKMQIQTR